MNVDRTVGRSPRLRIQLKRDLADVVEQFMDLYAVFGRGSFDHFPFEIERRAHTFPEAYNFLVELFIQGYVFAFIVLCCQCHGDVNVGWLVSVPSGCFGVLVWPFRPVEHFQCVPAEDAHAFVIHTIVQTTMLGVVL